MVTVAGAAYDVVPLEGYQSVSTGGLDMRGRGRLRRLCAGTGVFVAVGAAAAFGSSAPAGAAQPLVIDKCQAAVEGTPGQPIALRPAAVADQVVAAVETIPLVGATLAGQVGQAVGAMAAIPLGAVPASNGYISGATIASAATAALRTLPLLAPVVDTVLPSVQSALTTGCGITVHVVNAAAAPVQDRAGAPADTRGQPTGAPDAKPTTPPSAKPGNSSAGNAPPPEQRPGQEQPASTGLGGGTNAVGGLTPGDFQLYQLGNRGMWDFGRVPLYDYAGLLPFTTPGEFAPAPDVRYADQVPGSAPETGALTPRGKGAGAGVGSAQGAAASQSRVAAAAARLVATPVLLGVVAVAAVTAGLVCSRALRRSPSGSGRHRVTA